MIELFGVVFGAIAHIVGYALAFLPVLAIIGLVSCLIEPFFKQRKVGGILAKETRTKAQINAQRTRNEWNKKNMRPFMIQCHREYDKDIISFLEGIKASGESISTFIKNAIRKSM